MNETVKLNYDDPYSEILVKIVDALHEADLHDQEMSEVEYETFEAIRETIKTRDAAVLPESMM